MAYTLEITEPQILEQDLRDIIDIYVDDVLLVGNEIVVEDSCVLKFVLKREGDTWYTKPFIQNWAKRTGSDVFERTTTRQLQNATIIDNVVTGVYSKLSGERVKETLSLGQLIQYFTVSFNSPNAKLRLWRQFPGVGPYEDIRMGESSSIIKNDLAIVMQIIADEGYYFDKAGSYTMTGETYPITNPNPTTNTVSGKLYVNITGDIVATMTPTEILPVLPSTVIGFNHVYLVDKDKLTEISIDLYEKRRTYHANPTGSAIDPFIAQDPHTYIVSTIRLPFKIPPAYENNVQPIEIGYTLLTASALQLNSELISIDMGEIVTPPVYNNAYDYLGTTTTLHLPYAHPINLEVSYVMGQTIKLDYVVDVYTGQTTINVRSSLVDNNVIYSTTTFIANDIPFVSKKSETVIGNLSSTRAVIYNNVHTPYIEVSRNNPYQPDSMFNVNTRTTVDSLSDIKGRIIVHDIKLNSTMSLTEQSLIKSLLSSGITIN